MSRESVESEDTFLAAPTNVSPVDATFRERRAATLGSVEADGPQPDGELVPPPSPLYYKRHSLISPRDSPKSQHGSRTTSMGSFTSLQKYCSSLSIGSHLNLQAGQDSIPDFVVPSRRTQPRSSRLTSAGELVHYIKKNSSQDYQALIRDEMIQDELERCTSTPSDNLDKESRDSKLGSSNDAIDEATDDVKDVDPV